MENTCLSNIQVLLGRHLGNLEKKDFDALLSQISDLLCQWRDENNKALMRLQVQMQATNDEIDRLRTEYVTLKKDRSQSGMDKVHPSGLGKLQEENQRLVKMLQMREEELNRLYNLTETDLKYRVYYVLRDEAPQWMSFSDIYRFVNLPASDIRKHLKDFQSRGLIEIQDQRARAKLVIRHTTNEDSLDS